MRKQAAKQRDGHAIRRDAENGRRRGNSARANRTESEEPRGKIRLTMYLDLAVVEYFRSCAGGRGYQTLINEALKQAIEQERLEDVLRRVIREESRPYLAAKGKT
jgi:uncharacterized protein (DUF4415 family)